MDGLWILIGIIAVIAVLGSSDNENFRVLGGCLFMLGKILIGLIILGGFISLFA